ncbi:MAG: hypothetical protein JW955_01160 [Sedimentisphaerales bacterium]|nr:hypothetical protein [Sedimentisphaerales bacterium]
MKGRERCSAHGRFAGLVSLMLLLPFATGAGAQGTNAFESEIQAFERIDLTTPPPESLVLFVGSSSIRVWPDLPGAFPEYPVMNRGFGGSQMSDLLYYFGRIVVVYDPALIVVYEGDNDLAAGKSVDQVYADYTTFLSRAKQDLPRADVAFIAVKPSPSRAQYMEAMRQLNSRLEALAAGDRHVWYIDVFTPMLNDAGQPRPELFQSDLLHMNATGYALWKTVVGSMLDRWAMPKVQSLLLDFGPADATTTKGPAPDDPANFWNNVTDTIGSSPTGELLALVNTENRATDIGLKIVEPFNGSGPNKNGTLESAVLPANATRDSLYGNTKTWNGFADVFPCFKLIGLDLERVYNFTFYASRLGVSDVRETGYTITGANSVFVTLDAANNVDKVVTVTGVIPDALGEITISLAPTERNNNSYQFTYLGAMRVDEIPEQQPIIFVEEPADRTVEEFRSATFSVTVESTPPYTVQWFQDSQPIPDANDFTYTIDSVTTDLDGAAFSAKVSNLIYSATSAKAILHVIADVNAPVPVSAGSTNGFVVDLVFDERVDPNTAAAIGNYLVNAGATEVTSAQLDADGRTALLTLATRLTDAFDVSISGVRDLAGNEIPAGTTITGELHPQVLLIDFGASATPTTSETDDPVNSWNNVTDSIGGSTGGLLRNLVTTENVATDIGLEIVSRFNGANTNGTLASKQFPASATRDSLFGNTETFSGLADVFPKFKLTDLDPLLTYDFTFYASRLGVSDFRETGYSVSGGNTGFAVLNASGNVDNVVTVSGIRPDASGAITISLTPTSRNNNANHFTYLGAMRVEPTGMVQSSAVHSGR